MPSKLIVEKSESDSIYIKISRNYYVFIKNLFAENEQIPYFDKYFKENEEYCSIPIDDFLELMNEILIDTYIRHTYLPNNINVPDRFKQKHQMFLQDFNEELKKVSKDDYKDKYEKIRALTSMLISDLVSLDNHHVERVLNKAFMTINCFKSCYILKDLIPAIENAIQNLSLICDVSTVDAYKRRFQDILMNGETEKFQTLFYEMQTLILKNWEEFTTDINNYKSDDYFCFLCHSTRSTNFIGDFFNKYVSCLLLTPELTDTFHSGFGFIMNPINIVAASSDDMKVNNSAPNLTKLLKKTTIPNIDVPRKVVQKTLERKNAGDVIAYCEIVVEGFNPLAIFCITDGNINSSNYINATKLRESFPNLDIIEISPSLCKNPIRKTI